MLGLIREVEKQVTVENETTVALKKAKELIKNGWCKGKTCIAKGNKVYYCVLGAMLFANGLNVIEVFAEANNIKDHTIADWNDEWWRTKWGVLRAFDRAIEFSKIKTDLKN